MPTLAQVQASSPCLPFEKRRMRPGVQRGAKRYHSLDMILCTAHDPGGRQSKCKAVRSSKSRSVLRATLGRAHREQAIQSYRSS